MKDLKTLITSDVLRMIQGMQCAHAIGHVVGRFKLLDRNMDKLILLESDEVR
jgi:hypothetical protein